jgi:hypothetical protein
MGKYREWTGGVFVTWKPESIPSRELRGLASFIGMLTDCVYGGHVERRRGLSLINGSGIVGVGSSEVCDEAGEIP